MSPLSREAKIPGRIVISWTMSGGILFGMLSTLLTMARQLPGYDFFITISGTYLFGSVLGLLHGLVLGVFSRDAGTSFGDSFKQTAVGVLYSILAVPVSFLVTLWIGFAFYYRLDPTVGRLLGAIIGGWIGLSVLIWTAWETWRAVRIIVARWHDFVIAVGIVGTMFLVLVWFFYSFYPFVFEGNYGLGQAIFIAGGISVLIVGPLVTLALVGLRRIMRIQQLIQRLEQDA